MQPRPIPENLIARERKLLADALLASLEVRPRKRGRRMRKLSDHVERTWVSAGCFGEAVQWRLPETARPPEEFDPSPEEEDEVRAPEEFDPTADEGLE